HPAADACAPPFHPGSAFICAIREICGSFAPASPFHLLLFIRLAPARRQVPGIRANADHRLFRPLLVALALGGCRVRSAPEGVPVARKLKRRNVETMTRRDAARIIN